MVSQVHVIYMLAPILCIFHLHNIIFRLCGAYVTKKGLCPQNDFDQMLTFNQSLFHHLCWKSILRRAIIKLLNKMASYTKWLKTKRLALFCRTRLPGHIIYIIYYTIYIYIYICIYIILAHESQGAYNSYSCVNLCWTKVLEIMIFIMCFKC